MKRLYYLLIFSFIGTLFFCVLTEKFYIVNCIIGFFAGGAGAFIFNRNVTLKLCIKKPFFYFKKIAILVFDIFKSSIIIIKNSFKKHTCNFSEVIADKNISTVITANCITLTPGTVAIEKDKDVIKVLNLLQNS